MKRFFIFSTLVMLVISMSLQAQKRFMDGDIYSSDPIDAASFNDKLFQDVLFYKLNFYMDSIGLEGYEASDFLMGPSREHAIMMAEDSKASLEGSGRYKTVRDRLIAAGGTGIGDEVISRNTIKISNEYISYDALADEVVQKWADSKYSNTLFSQKYFFAGVSGRVEESGKKVFISMYVGNYASFLPSGDVAGELTVPVTTKTYGLKPYDERSCKKVGRKMPNYMDLQESLSLNDNGEIVFKYNDLKKFRRFLKGSKDGLAVDIVQKEQFNNCRGQNIADYSTVNIGYMTKRVWSKKIYKKNIAPGEGRRDKVTKLEVILGELPLEFRPEDVELNLMIIKDKSVCYNVPPSYVDDKFYDFVPKIGILPDTIITGAPEYAPTATSTELKFRIPFEQAKYDYHSEDMIPVLKALNEPDFIINQIYIAAYSSLEGTQHANQILQKRRAQSIVKAFEKNQNASIVDSIVTESNFEALKNDAKGTIYDEICQMDLDQAIIYVNNHAKEMEFLLNQHRYADIVVWVTYDISDGKEQRYVVDQFNKAVEAKQFNKALAIQKYILKRVVEGLYDENAVSDMRIPQGKEYVGLNMNKIWLTQFIFKDALDDVYLEKINDLNTLDQENIYVEYNDILCEVTLLNLENEDYTSKTQERINRIYNTPINVELVDLLNIELQFQVMDIYKDSLGYNHPLVTKSINKIKEIIKFDELTWENSLKLSSVFINHGDYEYAVKLLEPWVFDSKVPFVLLTSYATACSKVQYRVHSKSFYFAMEKIKQHDSKFFCDLFKGDKLSVQTFVNTEVKKLWCETCKK
ncbi:MAG: hypothetical protein PHP52_05910 [Bacteroidales bacterium]|nr:hypothetical protein [Bacteroidales bacterium]MDD4217012.1 hypothetical protein [Bacteroidales bacterium]MDY0141867.1 hypothetical protein [Bacteroidales bacterium]